MSRPPRLLTSACAAGVVALAIAPWGSLPASADATDGTITFIVNRDDNGTGSHEEGVDPPQPRIKITVKDLSGQVREGVTDDNGEYVLKGADDLTGGRYFVVADIPEDLGLEPVPASDTFESLSTTVEVTSDPQTVRFGVAAPAPSAAPSTSEAPPTTESPVVPLPQAEDSAPAAAPPQPESTPSFAVSGRVWEDDNRQGSQDDDEPPATGTSVQLLDADGKVLASTIARVGRYRFGNLEPGVYAVRFSGIDPGYRFSPTGVGGATRDSDADSNGVTAPFTLDVGAANVRESAGSEYLNATIDAGITRLRYAVGSQVWQDSNGDGIQQADESAGEARVTLLRAGGGGEVGTTTTDPTGRFLFEDLVQGRYRLKFDLGVHRQLTSAHVGSNPAVDSDPDPRSRTTAVFTLDQSSAELVPARDFGPVDADFVDTTLNAGVVGSYTVANRVWNDSNGDGLLSPGESGIARVLVEVLDPAGVVVASTITDRSGRYEFTSLPEGRYQLRFSRLRGLHFTATGAGGDPAADSDVYRDGLTAPFTVGEDHPVETAVAAGLTASATTAVSAAPTTSPAVAASATGAPTLSATGGPSLAVPLVGTALLLAGGTLVLLARRRRH